MNDVVGFIGLGQIGLPMAKRIRGAGFVLIAHDGNADATKEFDKVASTPREVADLADVVITCLPNAAAHRSVVLGPDGIVAGRRCCIHVHTGTSGLALVEELAAGLAPAGIETVDAPMSGGPAAAREGRLAVMTAGPTSAVERVRPVLDAYAASVTYLGDRPGMAQALKLTNNMLTSATLAVASQAFRAACRVGLDPRQVIEVWNGGLAASKMTEKVIPDFVMQGTFNFGSHLESLVKDVELAVELLQTVGLSEELLDGVGRFYRQSALELGPTSDITTIFQDRDMTEPTGDE